MELIPEEIAKNLRELADRIENADAIHAYSYVRQTGRRAAPGGMKMPDDMVPSGAFAVSVTWYEAESDQTKVAVDG